MEPEIYRHFMDESSPSYPSLIRISGGSYNWAIVGISKMERLWVEIKDTDKPYFPLEKDYL